MEALLLFIFVAFVFGGMYLILACGYQSIEAERAKSENAQAAEQLQILQEPRFFAKVGAAAPAEPAPLMPAHLIERLEQRLQREYQGAELFASQPSRERICSGYGAYVDTAVRNLERHIQRERAATTAFVAEPSVERLCTHSARPIDFPDADPGQLAKHFSHEC